MVKPGVNDFATHLCGMPSQFKGTVSAGLAVVNCMKDMSGYVKRVVYCTNQGAVWTKRSFYNNSVTLW